MKLLSKGVFATNSNFLVPISLQPDGVNLWFFEIIPFDLKEFTVLNIKVYAIGLQRYRD